MTNYYLYTKLNEVTNGYLYNRAKKSLIYFLLFKCFFKLKDFQMLRLHMEIQKWEKTWFSSIMTLC